MERIFQSAQLQGAETTQKISRLFMQKVQLEDQLQDVEAQIHFNRGVLETIGQIQELITQTIKQDGQRKKYEEEAARYETEHGGDGHSTVPVPEVNR